MDRIILNEYKTKLQRLRDYMDQNNYDVTIISTRDHFAWLTCGGDNKVFCSSDVGFGVLLVTWEQVFLIAESMDIDRIYDDELDGFDIEKVQTNWNGESRIEIAKKMAHSQRILSDLDIDGVENRYWDLIMLHYPLLDSEIERFIEIGKKNDEIIFRIANKIVPGMNEHEIEAELMYEYAKDNFQFKVILIGSDARISKYRHPNASYKQVKNTVLLHAATSKSGLNCAVTRFVCFGDNLSKDQAMKHDLLNILETQAISMCRPGVKMWDIIKERRKILSKYGCQDEFYKHYPGVLSGYTVGSSQPIIDNVEVIEGMAFAWFITLTGAKVEETCISTKNGGKLITSAGVWPTKVYEWNGFKVNLPTIYMR